MSILDVVAIGITMIWSLFCTWVLDRKLKDMQENVPSKRKILIYGGVMLVCNIFLVVLMIQVYVDLSFLYIIKRIGILGIIWIIAPIDYKFYKIPNEILILGLIARGVLLVGELLFEREYLLETLLSAGIGMLIIVIVTFLCSVLIKGSIGAGDIKLMLVMAMFQEATGVFSALFTSMVVSFFVSIILLVSHKKKRNDTIPFGPNVLVGTYLSIFLTGA